MDCWVVVGAPNDGTRVQKLDWIGLGFWVFGRRDRAHRHPAPYSRSLLGRDRPHPHHKGTGSTWFKNRRCICVWGFRYFRQSFINILGGEEQIYKPVHEDIDRLVLLVFQLSRIGCSRERSCMLHIKIPIDKRLNCLFNVPCQASPYRSLDSSFKLL